MFTNLLFRLNSRICKKNSGETWKMSKFEAEVKKIVEVLGLKWAPIAARFSMENDEILARAIS